MPNIPSNSQATVVANNPYIRTQDDGTLSMMDFLPEAARITQPGGKIVINANAVNPHFNSLPTQAQLNSLGLKIEYQGPVLPQYSGVTPLRSDGSLITKPMQSLVFVKK
jgi:filamentous hemagglutinin